MKARIVPISETQASLVTTLTLPASWRTALLTGSTAGLTPTELQAIGVAQAEFGYCTAAEEPSAARMRDDHDVLAEGIGPTMCIDYTFDDVEHIDAQGTA